MINVRDFAKGDGVTDDTLACLVAAQKAHEAAASDGGCDLVFPPGCYKLVGSEIRITSPKIHVHGSPSMGSVVRQTNPAKHAFHFDYPDDLWNPTGGGIADLKIEAGAGWSTGFRGDGSEGAAVLVTNANDHFYIERVSPANFGTGFALQRCWNINIVSFYIYFCKWAGILFDTNAAGAQGGGNKVRHGNIKNNGYMGTGSPPGLDIRASGGEMIDDLDITKFYNAVKLCPNAAGKQVLDSEFTKIHGDTAISDAWLFDGTNGDVFSHGMTACRGAFSGGCGLRTRGDRVRSIRWNGGALRENHQHGLWREGGALVSVRGAEIDTNGVGSPDVYSGAHTGGGLDIELRLNTIGNGIASGLPASQKYGIEGPPGAGSYPNIGPNIFVGNLSGDTHL